MKKLPITILLLLLLFVINAGYAAPTTEKSVKNTNVATLCNANKGLELLNQKNPPWAEIKTILNACDKQNPKDVQTMMLHGLIARKKGIPHKNYSTAITWLKQAKAAARMDYPNPTLELAVTYEWAQQNKQAGLLYNEILAKNPNSYPATLGSARVALAKNDLQKAAEIYQALLAKNPNDIDALNGQARIALTKKQFDTAKRDFEKVQNIQPDNKDAQIGLKQVEQAQLAEVKKNSAKRKKQPINNSNPIIQKQLPSCNANEGLRLLNQDSPPWLQIQTIIAKCDQNAPSDVQTLLLHGLIARKQGETNKDYKAAIIWLQEAKEVAASDNFAPALELAITYEWALQPQKAKQIYLKLLTLSPNSRPALLGLARVERAQYHLKSATYIYTTLLAQNPEDTEALNGLAWVNLANKKFKLAKQEFETVKLIKPNDSEAQIGMQQLSDAYRYRLDVLGEVYSTNGEQSYSGRADFVVDVNATDQILILTEHNSKEIGFNFFTTPTLLPKNSVLIGFQRQIPDNYGWGVNYDYRQHTYLPLESRIGGNANIYLMPNLQVFGGGRVGSPSPWNNQLFYSGVTLYTDMPFNFTATGFWGNEEVGGHSTAYVFDISKEFMDRTFYDIGTAYSPTLENWEVHGRLIWPTFKNQALVTGYQHYFFNGSSYFAVGWRLYWQ